MGDTAQKNSSKNTGGRVSDYVYNRILPGYIELICWEPYRKMHLLALVLLSHCNKISQKEEEKQVMCIALFHIRGYVDFVESPIETGDPRHDE